MSSYYRRHADRSLVMFDYADSDKSKKVFPVKESIAERQRRIQALLGSPVTAQAREGNVDIKESKAACKEEQPEDSTNIQTYVLQPVKAMDSDDSDDDDDDTELTDMETLLSDDSFQTNHSSLGSSLGGEWFAEHMEEIQRQQDEDQAQQEQDQDSAPQPQTPSTTTTTTTTTLPTPRRKVVTFGPSKQSLVEYAQQCHAMAPAPKPHAAGSLAAVPLPQRQHTRASRQVQALERVEDLQLERWMDYEAEQLQQEAQARRERILQVYFSHGFPSKSELREIVARGQRMKHTKNDDDADDADMDAAEYHHYAYVTQADIELLPWMEGDLVVDQAAMMK